MFNVAIRFSYSWSAYLLHYRLTPELEAVLIYAISTRDCLYFAMRRDICRSLSLTNEVIAFNVTFGGFDQFNGLSDPYLIVDRMRPSALSLTSGIFMDVCL